MEKEAAVFSKVIVNGRTPLEVKFISIDSILFSFSLAEDKLRVLEGEGRPGMLRPLRLGKDLTKSDLKTISLWVSFPSVIEWPCVERIGSVVGNPLFTDKPTKLRIRLAYARLCLEVDTDAKKKIEIAIQIDA